MTEALAEFDPLAMPSLEKRGELSLEEYLRRDWDAMGDGLKYEWCDGFVEAGEENMHPDELKILTRLQRKFVLTSHYKEGGSLQNEMEIRSSEIRAYRRADVAIYSGDQIENADAFTVPKMVMEIISENDNAIHHEKKIGEYFASGVEVYWQIFPEIEFVRIYQNRKQGIGCSGDDLCSAAPAFPEFEMTAAEIFGS